MAEESKDPPDEAELPPNDMSDDSNGLFAGLHLVKSETPDEPKQTPNDFVQGETEYAAPNSQQDTATIANDDGADDATEHHSNASVKREEEIAAVPEVTSAPVTDKLLSLFGGDQTESPPRTTETTQDGDAKSPAVTDGTEEAKGQVSAPINAAPETMSKPASEKVEATKTAPNDSGSSDATANDHATTTTEEEAFHVVTEADMAPTSPTGSTLPPPPPSPSVSSLGDIHPDTPIPNSDVALRLLRKFASKTQPHIAVSQGGTKASSVLGYLFSTSASEQDSRMVPYAALMEILNEGGGTDETEETPTSTVVDSILGHEGDDMTKARHAMAAFCHLLSTWCHASSSHSEKTPSQKVVMEYLPLAMDSANALVAHGNFDEVKIGADAQSGTYTMAIHVVCESILAADLSSEKAELAALKLLLTSGCRSSSEGNAILRGSHLLQTIRVLYHVYLTTDSKANRTTARAALQQLVTSVFKRMIFRVSSSAAVPPSSKDDFPSENHRDAFLVLRSLCKLSMRSLPDPLSISHSGLQTTGSNVVWDANNRPVQKQKSEVDDGEGKDSATAPSEGTAPRMPVDPPMVMLGSAVHSAFDSKILALELMLYVLQNTNMSGDFLRKCGPQFQYAIRNYLCVSLLKNCTSDNTTVVNLSLKLFVPLIRNFRSHLKTEIEAFVTNVFFVILDSKNSTMEHKIRVVSTFDEICSDPATLAEIFLNYDCDLSAVDLFHRIVNTLSRVAKTDEAKPASTNFVAGAGAARMEKLRNEQRELRLDAMRALRQVLASLHASIVAPVSGTENASVASSAAAAPSPGNSAPIANGRAEPSSPGGQQSLVQIYDSKKKRRKEESEAILRFNQKPSAGMSYAAKCGHIDGGNPVDVARYLLKNKDVFEKTQIGEYLGREAEYQGGFSLKVLHEYVNILDFKELPFDDAIRYYLSGFRLPGEAQKIDRIMEKFAERYTIQNPAVFPTADVAFILAFSIIMLNTDLHNPAIKEERRMTREGFIRNNRGICDGKDLPEEFLNSIFDRIKSDPISLKEDDEARERAGEGKQEVNGSSSSLASSGFFSSHYQEMDRARESNFQKERDQIVRTTESLLRRKKHSSLTPHEHGKSHTRQRSGSNSKQKSSKFVRSVDAGLRDEYVSPMFEVTWAPALAAFSTAMESANGTVGALLSIATEDELELAAENAAETIEVCLSGCRLAICTAGLCGNDTARDAFMLALSRFSQLGTGTRLEPRHIRCAQTLLSLAKDDGELLGNTWEHVFRALSEVDRFHQLFHLMARNDRAAAAAAERRRKRLEAREQKRLDREQRNRDAETADSSDGDDESSTASDESSDSEHFSDVDDYLLDDEMDARAIDEANARAIYDAVSESTIETIYQRSASLSQRSIMEFVYQLCRVSRMEISGYGGHVGSQANTVDLTQVHYRQQHTLLHSSDPADHPHHNQPNIYSLQKLVEVTHYNMEARPRLVFSEIWTTVSGHLTSTALHSNAAVAMYAVDSFRQLSIQYLQREELGVFEFQRRFLKPFETVMARSEHSTTRELLLKCVERIIFMFGSDAKESNTAAASLDPSEDGHHGTLKSGWRPVLAVLGLAGHDEDEAIAKLGFDMLTEQLRQCLTAEKDEHGVNKPCAGVLLAERFVDLVDALLMYVSGPQQELGFVAIDHLVTLSTFLADDRFALPLVRTRSRSFSAGSESESSNSNQELELWWPILLGLSRSIGDARKKVRLKSLVTLFGIINQHFFSDSEEKRRATEDSPRHGDLQTLQLIFRGILTPVLEHAESDAHVGPKPSLPDDFKRFMTKSPASIPSEGRNLSWIETTFEHFMDGSVAVCMRSIETFEDDSLVEEVFAMLNSCLLSDSGILAVRGLRRLEQFITEDLERSYATDDTWATVSHMLRRCLAVRGLPSQSLASASQNGSKSSLSSAADGSSYAEDNANDAEAMEALNEFVMEDRMMEDRRYIGSNVAKVITSLLSNERYSTSIGMRWRLFLIGGLGQGIQDWERAAKVIGAHSSTSSKSSLGPPSYMENASYGRLLMNKLLLRLIAKKEVVDTTESGGSVVGARSAAAHVLLEEETRSLLSAFLVMEATIAEGTTEPWETSHMELLTSLVKQLVVGYDRLEDTVLFEMPWLCPILSSCIQSHDESVRLAVHELVQRVFKGTMVDRKNSGTQGDSVETPQT